MPRLPGHVDRERIPFHRWDCLNNDLRYERLFGRGNIGQVALCNMVIANQFESDTTGIITNWFARTTMPDGAERRVISSMTVATLWVGEKPMRQMPLDQLLRRHEGSALEGAKEDRVAAIEGLARMSYESYSEHSPMGATIGILGRGHQAKTFSDLSEQERRRWEAVADTAHRALKPRAFLIVPVRQTFRVDVTRDSKDSFGEHRVWIHLMGFNTRDVC